MSDDKQVGIVLVSHSAEVAASVAELAKGLAGGGTSVPVAPAGGTEGGGIGTSSELIAAAAAAVDRGAGVAVLTDLGSAVLTVKALLAEGDELPDNTRLVDAPFVEERWPRWSRRPRAPTWRRWRQRPRTRTATGRSERTVQPSPSAAAARAEHMDGISPASAVTGPGSPSAMRQASCRARRPRAEAGTGAVVNTASKAASGAVPRAPPARSPGTGAGAGPGRSR